MTPASALIVVSHPVARERFCGRTLVDRHTELLRRCGVADIHVVAATELPMQRPGGADADRILIVTAERLFDPRFVRCGARATRSCPRPRCRRRDRAGTGGAWGAARFRAATRHRVTRYPVDRALLPRAQTRLAPGTGCACKAPTIGRPSPTR